MLAHGLLNGTDTGSPYAAALYAGSLGLVGSAVVWRRLGVDGRRQGAGPRSHGARPGRIGSRCESSSSTTTARCATPCVAR